jgi:hypothetical protein
VIWPSSSVRFDWLVAILPSAVRDASDVVAVGDLALGDVAQRVEQRELVIGARHRRGERHARLLHVGLGGFFLRHRHVQARAVLAPKVELPGRADERVVLAVPRAAVGRREEGVGRIELAGPRILAGHLRIETRTRTLDIRRRLSNPRLRLGNRGAAGERLVDQLRQLRIAELRRPVERRPLAALRGQALRAFERFRRGELLVAADTGVICTAGERERRDRHGKRATRSAGRGRGDAFHRSAHTV